MQEPALLISSRPLFIPCSLRGRGPIFTGFLPQLLSLGNAVRSAEIPHEAPEWAFLRYQFRQASESYERHRSPPLHWAVQNMASLFLNPSAAPPIPQPRQRLSSTVLPSSSPTPTDMDQANPAPTAESLFTLLREIQSSMATLRRPRSPCPPSHEKRARIEEAPRNSNFK